MRELANKQHMYYFPPSGKSFIRVPRDIVNRLFHSEEAARQAAWLYFTLLVYCYYADGYVMLGRLKVPCNRGEYVGNRSRLSVLTGFSASTVGRLLRRLDSENLIRMWHIPGGSRIQLVGYDDITLAAKNRPDTPTAGQSLAAYEERLMRGQC